jgi:hypothetical protein
MIGGGGIKALLSSGGGKGLYAGVWGNLAGAADCIELCEGISCAKARKWHVRALGHVLLSSGGGKGLYAGVWGNLAGAAISISH